MAEVVLFKTELGETITSIKRLKEELKTLRSIYENAEAGSQKYINAQKQAKEVTAILKQQNDALKANRNALGGVNDSANFAAGSYGKLKQQIKENSILLDTLVVGTKEFDDALKQQTVLLQQRIDIEEKMPSLLQRRIKGGVEEANTIKELKDQIKEYTAAVIRGEEGAAQKLAELKDKLEDVKDATKTFAGSGVEQLQASMGMLRESIENFDLDKFKLGLEGLGASMKAIPIFLIIEGITWLLDKLGIMDMIVEGLTDAFYALTDALGFTNKEAEKVAESMIEGMNAAKEATENKYDAEIKLAKAAGLSTESIELKKLKATEFNLLQQTKIYQSLAKKKGELNDDEQKAYTKLQEELLKASTDRQVAEIEASKRLQAERIKYVELVKGSEDALKRARQSGTQNQIDDIRKTRDEQIKALEDQFQKGQIYNGNTKQAIAEFEKAKQNIIQASNIEVGKINAQAFAEAKAKRDKANQDELKAEQDKRNALIEGIKRNQQEEISYLETKIQERKNLNQTTFDEEQALAEYQLQIVLENTNATYEERYKAQVEFDTKMLDLEKQKLEAEKKLNDEYFQKDIEYRKSQQNIIIEEEKALNQVNYQDAITSLETQYEAKKELLDIQREQELYGLDEHSVKYQEIVAKYANQEIELLRQKQEEKAAINKLDIDSTFDTFQAGLNLAYFFADKQKQLKDAIASGDKERAAKAEADLKANQDKLKAIQRMMALVNIASSTATAISNLVAVSFSKESPDNIFTGGLAAYPKLIAGILTITTNMLQAKNALTSFEEGGYTGAGNSHEESTNLGTKSYTYHKDEYVIPSRVLNTPQGSIMASQLEGMRLGMSNPMPYIGGMFDGGFTGRSAGSSANSQMTAQSMMQQMIAQMPTPVVRVTDIDKVQSSSVSAVSVSSL